ncbi:MAG: Excalibur calcium-binding domain [Rhodobacteraceae bacterium HLUCCA12]|nr:MAG: Excalibur calcium-binding domain [Rhodobacteraceae bacterium HLUCCA12]
MRKLTFAGALALLALPACTDGGGGARDRAAMSSGVGFGDYRRYLDDREAARNSSAPYSVAPETSERASEDRRATARPPRPAADDIGAPMAAPMSPAATTADESRARDDSASQAPARPRDGRSSDTPQLFGTTPAFDAGPSVRPALSDEQDFAAVSSRETIESDRARLESQRAQYQIIEVDSVPDASVRAGPNVIEYALDTTHPVGEERYRRINPFRWGRWEANCLRYHNQNAAQEAFLAEGGPERDRDNLDPDGDGYACWWDPAPIRQAVRAAQ